MQTTHSNQSQASQSLVFNRRVNDAAIRLQQLDEALAHCTRNAAALGLGANAVRQNILAEKEAIRASLMALGDDLIPPEDRARADGSERQGVAS